MRWLAGVGVVVGAAVVGGACLSPTEIRVVLTSDVCGRIRFPDGVKVYVTTPEHIDDGALAPTAAPGRCVDGTLGDFYVVPSGRSGDIAIRVVADVDGVSPCTLSDNYAGCIVARRILRFVPHTQLTLPISLDANCVGIQCDPGSTCFDGRCLKATIENALDCASARGCVPTASACVAHLPQKVGCNGGPAVQCGVGAERCCQCNGNCFDVCFTGADIGCMGTAPTKTIVECDDTADCVQLGKPGVCCGRNHVQGKSEWSVIQCATDCTPPSDTIFCDPQAGGTCPVGQACTHDFDPWCGCQ